MIAGKGEDILINQFGSDYFSGDKGNDRIISLSDSGIPTGNNIPILDNDSTENQLSQLDFSTNNINPNGLAADDTLIGGKHADRFEFHLLINARKEIVDKYTDVETGIINWGMNGVAGENDNYHDHWVDGIGNDIIQDFTSKEGDKILISGHTVQAILLENNETLNEALVGVYSDQGADGRRGNGAHDWMYLEPLKSFTKEVLILIPTSISSKKTMEPMALIATSLQKLNPMTTSFWRAQLQELQETLVTMI